MSDIAGIGSFQVGFNRSIPPQAHSAQVDQQHDADLTQQRVDDRTTVGTDNNARGFDSSQSGAGSDNLDSSGAGSEPQDQITISTAAQQQTNGSDSDTAPGEDGRQQLEDARESARDIALGRNDPQQTQGSSVSFGNAGSDQSEQTRTLGQVVDIFA